MTWFKSGYSSNANNSAGLESAFSGLTPHTASARAFSNIVHDATKRRHAAILTANNIARRFGPTVFVYTFIMLSRLTTDYDVLRKFNKSVPVRRCAGFYFFSYR